MVFRIELPDSELSELLEISSARNRKLQAEIDELKRENAKLQARIASLELHGKDDGKATTPAVENAPPFKVGGRVRVNFKGAGFHGKIGTISRCETASRGGHYFQVHFDPGVVHAYLPGLSWYLPEHLEAVN